MALPTRQDLELAIATYDAINGRDFESITRVAAPDGVLETRLETYRGHDELRRYYEEVVPTDLTSTPQAFVLMEDGIVVLSEISMTGPSSRIASNERIVESWEIEDGLIRHLTVKGFGEGVESFGLAERLRDIDSLRTAYEHFNRAEFDAALSFADPDIELNRGAQNPEGEAIRGVDAVRRYLEPEIFEDQHLAIESIVVRGDRLLASVVFSIKATGSGIEMSNPGHQIWTTVAGKATRYDFFQFREEALEFLFEDD